MNGKAGFASQILLLPDVGNGCRLSVYELHTASTSGTPCNFITEPRNKRHPCIDKETFRRLANESLTLLHSRKSWTQDMSPAKREPFACRRLRASYLHTHTIIVRDSATKYLKSAGWCELSSFEWHKLRAFVFEKGWQWDIGSGLIFVLGNMNLYAAKRGKRMSVISGSAMYQATRIVDESQGENLELPLCCTETTGERGIWHQMMRSLSIGVCYEFESLIGQVEISCTMSILQVALLNVRSLSFLQFIFRKSNPQCVRHLQ